MEKLLVGQVKIQNKKMIPDMELILQEEVHEYKEYGEWSKEIGIIQHIKFMKKLLESNWNLQRGFGWFWRNGRRVTTTSMCGT